MITAKRNKPAAVPAGFYFRTGALLPRLLIAAAAAVTLQVSLSRGQTIMDTNNYRTLTAEEKRVIIDKGTEVPFSGTYNDFFQNGTYTCRQCAAPLYRSGDKFDAGCGWPAFDDEIPGAVIRRTDRDGRRTEILCAACGAHLGHVFSGERYTEKNVRHCVNSISLDFVPAAQPDTAHKAWFAGGCFWGVEHLFEQKDGVISAVSGYMGGDFREPSYDDVLQGGTGHLETVEVTYDPAKISYEELAKYFFEIHDPAQKGGQGPDVGPQYTSAVFTASEAERETVRRLIGQLKQNGIDAVTSVREAKEFWKAEEYHQDYYRRKGQEPYCHIYKKRF